MAQVLAGVGLDELVVDAGAGGSLVDADEDSLAEVVGEDGTAAVPCEGCDIVDDFVFGLPDGQHCVVLGESSLSD